MASICSIPGCGNPTLARGWCNAHWKRWSRHGDPLAGRPSGKYRVETPCSVDGCDRTSKKLGFCGMHYQRFYKYGDPLQTAYEWGAAQAFFRDVVLKHDTDECLIWPFYRNENGYGEVLYKGQKLIASRAVCIEVHGEPPTEAHHAAHSCGKGQEGCVTPAHLSWKTAAENCFDKVGHGTLVCGERNWNARLTEADVSEVRAMLRRGFRQESIAEMFGVSRVTIADIGSGRTWKHSDKATASLLRVEAQF